MSSEAEITSALEGKKVGDTVKFTVTRNNNSQEIEMTLAEYVPSVKPNNDDSDSFRDYQSNDDFWQQLLNW